MTKLTLLLAVVALAVLGAVAADQLQCLKANPQGEIVLTQEAKIGHTTLPPGTYVLHSSSDYGWHYVHFVEESKHFEVHPEASEYTFSSRVAEVNCATRVSGKAASTAVFFIEEPGGMRIKEVEIKGEDHIHAF